MMIKKGFSKKGMLLASETLKMILSIISIGILVFLLAAIYFSTSEDKNLDEAKSVMEKINVAFDSFNQNKTEQELDGIGPGGWKIFFYTDTENKPNSCAGLDCICICNEVTFDIGNSQLNKCTKNGVCEIFEPLVDNEDFEIEKDGSTNILVYKEDNWFGVKEI